MTITSALPITLRTKIARTGAILTLSSAAFAPAATPLASVSNALRSPAQQATAFTPTSLSVAPMRQVAPFFPAVGLIVAAWATQHVRRRNARQLSAAK